MALMDSSLEHIEAEERGKTAKGKRGPKTPPRPISSV